MRCYACHQLNRDDVRFCVECGASLALTTWAQPTPPAGPHVPPLYAPPESVPHVATMAAAAPAAYPPGAPVPGGAEAPYGYILVPAPAPGPSVVNNVTVTQTPLPASAPAAPQVVAAQHADGLGIFLRALYFLGSGVVLGVLWDEAGRASSDGNGGAIALALLVTLLVLVLHMVVLHRLARNG
jgi:hypothetical protein